MTIESSDTYIPHELIPLLSNSNRYIGIVKPESLVPRQCRKITKVHNNEETSTYLELSDNIDISTILNIIHVLLLSSRRSFRLSHEPNVIGPGFVICADACNLTNQLVSEEFWKIIWELNTGLKKIDEISFEGQIFVVFAGSESLINTNLHDKALNIDII